MRKGGQCFSVRVVVPAGRVDGGGSDTPPRSFPPPTHRKLGTVIWPKCRKHSAIGDEDRAIIGAIVLS